MSRAGIITAVVLLGLCASCSKQVGPGVQTTPSFDASMPRTLTHTVREGESLERLADLYYGDPARAVTIAAQNGIDVDTRLVPGSVLQLRFDPAEYDRARRRAAALEPYNSGVTALAQGDLVEAERQFRLALRTVPDLPDARYNLAVVLLRRGQAEAAGDLLTGLVDERPDDADAGFALGNALFRQTRYLDAAAAFARVLERHPDHRRAAFGHARSLHEAGSRREARAAWRRYLELDSDSSWADEARRHLRELQGG